MLWERLSAVDQHIQWRVPKATVLSGFVCSIAVLCGKAGAGHTQSRMMRTFCSGPEDMMGKVMQAYCAPHQLATNWVGNTHIYSAAS